MQRPIGGSNKPPVTIAINRVIVGAIVTAVIGDHVISFASDWIMTGCGYVTGFEKSRLPRTQQSEMALEIAIESWQFSCKHLFLFLSYNTSNN